MYTTGLRSYSPTLGRWINRDPIGEDGGVNIYGFVENEPNSLVDIIGLENNGNNPIIPRHELRQIVARAPRGELEDAWIRSWGTSKDAVDAQIEIMDWGDEHPRPSQYKRFHSNWNPSGHAAITHDTRIGAFHGVGGEIGDTILRFDNGCCQRYSIISMGVGFGFLKKLPKAGGTLTKGDVYGAYQPKDYAGPFVGSSLSAIVAGSVSTWPPVPHDDSVSSATHGFGLLGITGTFQIYVRRGKPYKCSDDGHPID